MSEAIRNIMDEEIQTAFSMFDHEGTDTIDLSVKLSDKFRILVL